MEIDYSKLFLYSPLAMSIYEASTFKILDVNQAAINHYGYSRAEFLSLSITQLTIPEEVPKLLDAHQAIDHPFGNIFFGVFTHQKKSGELIKMEINGHQTVVDGKDCIMVILQDVTEKGEYLRELKEYQKQLQTTPEISKIDDWTFQQKTELESEFLNRISSLFSQFDSLSQSLKKLCEVILDYGSFSFSEIWLPSPQQKTLKLFASSKPDPIGELFYKESQGMDEFSMQEGLPGKVWEKRMPQLIAVDSMENAFLRKNAAQKVGIKSVMGIPLFNSTEIVGVLVVGSSFYLDQLKPYQLVLSRLETFLGKEISRKRLEADLSHLFEALPDLICLADFEGRFLKINEAGCRLLGYSEAELVGFPIDNFVYPADRDISLAELMKLKQGETVFKFENRYVSKTGETIWLSWNCNSQVEEGVIYASAKNITEEKYLRELVDNAVIVAKIGAWEVDMVQKRVTWSSVVHQLHETDHGSFEPDLATAINFYREDFREFVSRTIEKSIETGMSFDFEAPIITAKGKELWVRAIGGVEFFEGQCLRLFGSFQDISDRKESSLRLQSISDDLPGVAFQYILKPDGSDYMQSVSRAAMKIWGIPPRDCEANIQLVWDQIKAGGDYDEVINSISKSISTGSKWNCKWRNILPSGELRWHEGFGSPSKLSDGTVVFNSMIFDVTEEKKATILYDQTSETAKLGIWEVYLNSGEVFLSRIALELHELEENTKITLEQGINFYRSDYRDYARAKIMEGIEQGKHWEFELPIITAKGNERWIKGIGQAEIVDGKTRRIYGSIQDIHERKMTELRLKAITDDLPGVAFQYYLYPSGVDKLLSVTSGSYKIWGISPEECEANIDNVWNQILKGGQFEQVLKDIMYSVETLTQWHSQWKSVLPTGEIRWHEGYGTPYKLDDGTIVYNSMVFDITEKKKAAEDLQVAYEEKNMILESIGDGFFAVDSSWVVTYWNREAERILGMPREQIVGKNLWDVYADATELEFYHKYHEAKETGKTIAFEEYYPGVSKWFEVTVYPSQKGLAIFFKDVTLRKKTDIKILQANERFEKVTEATNDAIWDWNIEENTLYWGNGFQTLFGYDVENVTPTVHSWSEHVHPDDLEAASKSLDESILSHRDSWMHEYRYMKSNGEYAFVVDKGKVIRNEKGKPIRMVGAMTDISLRRAHELELLKLNQILIKHSKELEVTNEQLEQFAFIASHDLQEPLRMITGFLGQLKRKYSDSLDEKANLYINFAVDGAKRMRHIILDLLEYSRAGIHDSQVEIIDLNKLMKDYFSLRRKIIAEKKAVITYDQLPIVNANNAPLVQTFHCLLDNSLKYCKDDESPKIQLSFEEFETYFQFKISDNGIGISEEFFEKIFIIFQRLHNNEKYEGTGIGLAIAKKNIESWGGKIWLNSKPGVGTEFNFTLNKMNNEASSNLID